MWWEYFLLFQAKCSRPEFVFCRLCTPVLEFGGLENVCNLWIIVWNHFPKQMLWLSHNLFFFGYVWFSAHFCLWWLKYTYIFFSSIRWLFMFIRVLPICNWELYELKSLFSVILNSRRGSPGLMCYLPFSYFLIHFLDYIWYVPHRYVLDRATLIFLARRQTRKKINEKDLVLYSFL